jgi:hypothetical protein
MGIADNPEHWRERAEYARMIAEQMSDPESRYVMLDIVRFYTRLAERAKRLLLLGREPNQIPND